MPKHRYGVLPDRNDPRDLRFSAVVNKLQLVKLPSKVDLRPMCSPVRNQGDLGSCTGFASITGFRETLMLAGGKPLTTLSPLFQYYFTRVREHTVNEDSGASIRATMKTLSKKGAAEESDWPYDITKFTVKPTAEAIADAKKYPIKAYHRINTVMEAKQALSIKHPVVIGFEVWDSFETDAVSKTGVIPIPDFFKENLLGGHAMCLVGYDDATGTFTAKNSWSDKWGDDGYCYLPYGFFAPKKRLVFDMWTGKA